MLPATINRLPSDGYLVLPISMSRTATTQNAAGCYEILQYFAPKLESLNTDVIILYTDGLYANNSEESSWTVRQRLLTQMTSHRGALTRLIRKDRKFPPRAVHFLSWEQLVLDAPDFGYFRELLYRRLKSDKAFRDLLLHSLGDRPANDAHINFLIEETALTHIIRQKLVPFPRTLVREDAYRLVVYPGPYIAIDLYQWKHGVLPQKKDGRFYASQYNFNEKVLYNFEDMQLPENLSAWPRESKPHQSSLTHT